MTDTVAHTAVRPALAFIPDLIARVLPASLISLIIRVAIAAVFFLSGRTKDKNIGYIAEYLTNIGVDLREVRVVPDISEEIVAALNAPTRPSLRGDHAPSDDALNARVLALGAHLLALGDAHIGAETQP